MIIVLKPSATEEQITKFTNMLKESYDVKVNKCSFNRTRSYRRYNKD